MNGDSYLKEEEKKIVISHKNFILAIIGLAFLIRVLLVFNYGNRLYTFYDDKNYIYGAIMFIKNRGIVTFPYTEEQMMYAMPGTMMLLGFLFKIFSYTQNGMNICRIIWGGGIGSLTIYGIYKIVSRTMNEKIAVITMINLAIWPPVILNDCLFLSDTPMILCLVWFVYFTLKFCDSKSDRDFIALMAFYLGMIIFRSNFAIIPLAFIFYFWHNKFPIKELFVKGIYAVVIIVMFLTPWWIRNYKVVGEFVPMISSGDALLGGTMTGKGFPEAEMTLDEYRYAFTDENAVNIVYERMEKEKELGLERLAQWWKDDKAGLIKNYLITKPAMSLGSPYYQMEIFDISSSLMKKIYRFYIFMAAIGVALGLINKKHRQISFLFILFIAYSVLMCGIFLPFPGYNKPIIPFLFVFASMGMMFAFNIIKNLLHAAMGRVNEYKAAKSKQ
ncbi:MAG: glycosyltransferase family 39 protein [Firmicutes bacterium]|nr:glycosyltransferase family 39 protein [Bacillota bacterium]